MQMSDAFALKSLHIWCHPLLQSLCTLQQSFFYPSYFDRKNQQNLSNKNKNNTLKFTSASNIYNFCHFYLASICFVWFFSSHFVSKKFVPAFTTLSRYKFEWSLFSNYSIIFHGQCTNTGNTIVTLADKQRFVKKETFLRNRKLQKKN